MEVAAREDQVRSRARFAKLVEQSAYPFFSCTVDGTVVWANRKFAEVIGIPLGTNIGEVIHPDDVVHAAAQFTSLLRGAEEVRITIRLPLADGSFQALDVHVSAMLDEEGSPVELVGSVERLEDSNRFDARLRHEASHDGLTGLLNRRSIGERLDFRLVADDGYLAVLFIDLDDFKEVNDSLGHAAGDDLLKIISERLQGCVRGSDMIGRYGGDEFLVITQGGHDVEDALALAHRVAHEISQPAELANNMVVRPRASIGVAIRSEQAATSARLLVDADLAMYRAKREELGVVVADQALRDSAARRSILERDVPAALQAGEFRYHYQPVYHLLTGEVLGVEALLRWEHPALGRIAPPEIIECVDRLAMTDVFTAWSVDQVGHELARLREQLPSFRDKQFSFNLSARQLSWPGYVDAHVQVLDRYGIRPEDLIVEVTESGAIEVGKAAEETLRRLAGIGITLALDDFGVGFNALSYFTRFAIHAVKIDRSLVAAAPTKKPAAAIVRSLVELGHRLDLNVVAEGIETAEESEVCVELGVTTGQGFLYGPAVTIEELVQRGTDGGAWGTTQGLGQQG